MEPYFTTIIAWKKAHEFVLAVYDKTKGFPLEERHGLWSQFTRAAVSVAANIVEGSRKLSKADKMRFLNISQASLDECRYYIILAKDLKYLSEADAQSLQYLADGASWYINAYADGISRNTGITD